MSNASTYLSSGGTAIKSVQRGTISSTASSATATITSVDVARSVVKLMDVTPGQNGNYCSARVELTNATTVTMYNAYGVALSSAASATWELVEYAAPIKSIQHVSVTLSGENQGTSSNTTITAVNLSKTILEFRGYSGGGASLSADVMAFMLKGELTSNTNLRVYNRSKQQTPFGLVGYFTIVEFF
jgi:hypothetical protein